VDGDEEAAVGVATANVEVDGHGFVMADLGMVVPACGEMQGRRSSGSGKDGFLGIGLDW